MAASKKPPPDTVENILGRIGALKLIARQNASMDAKEGVDKMRALGKRMKAIQPALKKLQIRLERARKLAPPKPKPEASSKKEARKGTKKAKKKAKDDESDGDLLSKLDSL